MGRKKPGKPRRPRIPRQYTLAELQPPGDLYDEWYSPGPNPKSAANDPQMDPDARELAQRLNRLTPTYRGKVPKAAIYLDMLIDRGELPVFQNGETGTIVPLEEFAKFTPAADGDVRRGLHELHAAGMMLVFTAKDGVWYTRTVLKRPSQPGETWHFVGDQDVAVATTCVPDGLWDELPVDVAVTVMYLRSYRSQLEEPDPAEYGRHKGVNGTEHAKELFAAAEASGWVDYKGCDACPAGHLCTRTDA